jgi:hypothetical protein
MTDRLGAISSRLQAAPETRDIANLGKTATLFPLRFHKRSCANCRYYREHETVAVVSECLLHGRTLGIAPANDRHWLATWARERLCDLWSRRPKSWRIFSKGVESNPHFRDPYLPRELNQRRRARILARGIQEQPQ